LQATVSLSYTGTAGTCIPDVKDLRPTCRRTDILKAIPHEELYNTFAAGICPLVLYLER